MFAVRARNNENNTPSLQEEQEQELLENINNNNDNNDTAATSKNSNNDEDDKASPHPGGTNNSLNYVTTLPGPLLFGVLVLPAPGRLSVVHVAQKVVTAGEERDRVVVPR